MRSILDHVRGVSGALPLLLLLVVALALRVIGLDHGMPHGYYPDETHFIKRSLAFGSFDLNPHWFHKPALFMYLLFFEYGIYFVVGKVLGWFASVDQFAVRFVSDPTGFYLIGRFTVVWFGLGGIYLTHRIAKTASGRVGGWIAALFLTATAAHAASSQHVKADIPSAFFTLLSLLFLVQASQTNRARFFLLSALTAGFGMATKYYAIYLLVPLWITGFLLSVRGSRSEATPGESYHLRSPARSYGLLLLSTGVFLLGFFLASPYNFLDPFWYDVNLRPMIKARASFALPLLRLCDLYLGVRLNRTNLMVLAVAIVMGYGLFVGGRELVLRLSKSKKRRYALRSLSLVLLLGGIGLPAVFWAKYTDSVLKLGRVILSPSGMGPYLGGFCLVSTLLLILRRDRFVLILVSSLVSFVILANVYLPNVTEPRHLNAMYPLLAIAGAIVLIDLGKWFKSKPIYLCGFACILSVPGTLAIARNDWVLMKEDTRSEASRWIEANIPKDTGIVSDKDWVKLFASRKSIAAKRVFLGTQDDKSAFAVHRDKYLDLLGKAADAHDGSTYDLLVLDPPWWAREERKDGVYNDTRADRDMGDPTAHRMPYTLAEYARRGYRYVVTTSKTFRQFTREPWRSAWPTLASFYDELLVLTPIKVIEAQPNRRPGPEVRIYELSLERGL